VGGGWGGELDERIHKPGTQNGLLGKGKLNRPKFGMYENWGLRLGGNRKHCGIDKVETDGGGGGKTVPYQKQIKFHR